MRSPMEHRHVSSDRLGRVQMADIVARGDLAAWVGLRDALRGDGALRHELQQVCIAHIAMDEELFVPEFAFWKSYLERGA